MPTAEGLNGKGTVADLGDIMSSGQCAKDYETPLVDWKQRMLNRTFEHLTAEEKARVWVDFVATCRIGPNQEDGEFAEHEAEAIRKCLLG